MRIKAYHAVSLNYDHQTDSAPKVGLQASGKELVSELKRIARRYEIPIASDEALCRSLKDIEENQEVPPETYERIAKLFLA